MTVGEAKALIAIAGSPMKLIGKKHGIRAVQAAIVRAWSHGHVKPLLAKLPGRYNGPRFKNEQRQIRGLAKRWLKNELTNSDIELGNEKFYDVAATIVASLAVGEP